MFKTHAITYCALKYTICENKINNKSVNLYMYNTNFKFYKAIFDKVIL